MPFIRLKQIREMSSEERAEKVREFRTELSKLRAMIKVGASIDDPSRIREIKKAIALLRKLERDIVDLVLDFVDATGLKPKDIRIIEAPVIGRMGIDIDVPLTLYKRFTPEEELKTFGPRREPPEIEDESS